MVFACVGVCCGEEFQFLRVCFVDCVCVCVWGERFCFWGFLVGLGGWMMYGDGYLEGVLCGSLIDRVIFFCVIED